MRIEFKTRNIGLVPNFLSVPACEEIVRRIETTVGEPGHLVRAGRGVLDPSVRSCREHGLSQALSESIGKRFVRFLGDQRNEIQDEVDSFDGPYFLSYGPGSFFRSHRDVGAADDPVSMTTRRWSLILYLNGREPEGALPTFDGGALTLYDAARGAANRRLVIIPRPGLLALFRSSLLHEVMMVREGTRYAVVGWVCTSQLTDIRRTA